MITSVTNKKIKEIHKLKENRNIKKYQKYLIEGVHLVEEALKSELVEEIIVSENFTNSKVFDNFYGEVTIVSENVFKSLTDTVTTQGVIAVCKIENKQLDITKYSRVLILDQVQDPGNLGTIIRSALAFGVSSIILSEGCVDLYNPKVVRATQGMIFHINIYRVNGVDELIDILSNYNNIYTTNVNCGEDVRCVNSSNYVLIVGNEGNGVRDIISDMATSSLYINMSDKVESLNVGVACSILLYELGK